MKYVWDVIFWYFHIQNWRLDHYSLLMNYFQIWKMKLFSLHVQVFFTFLPHRTYSFSGPCFCCSLSSWFPLSPSLCRSDRGDGGCCQPSVNNTGDFLDVYQLPLSFINVHLFITGLCTIYIRDAHCACHKESFFIVNSKEPAL